MGTWRPQVRKGANGQELRFAPVSVGRWLTWGLTIALFMEFILWRDIPPSSGARSIADGLPFATPGKVGCALPMMRSRGGAAARRAEALRLLPLAITVGAQGGKSAPSSPTIFALYQPTLFIHLHFCLASRSVSGVACSMSATQAIWPWL